MNKSRLLVAVAVLVVLCVAVVITVRSRESQTTIEKPSTSLPTIKKEQVSTLEITRPGQPTLVLSKEGEKWRITAPVDAPAGRTDVEAAIDKLVELNVTGVAATRKENHKLLEIDPEHAIRVKAKDGDKVLVDLHIGGAGSAGTAVRVEGEDTVLTAKGSFRYVFDQDAKDFRNRDLTDFDAKELTGITLSSSKGTFNFVREGEGDSAQWAQAKGDKPIAKFDPSKVERLAEALSSLRAVDFATPEEEKDASITGLDPPQGKAVLTKKDGSTIEILVGKKHKDETEHFAKSSASPVVYRITNFSSERIMADAKAFEKPEPRAEPEGATGMPPTPTGLPEGMPPELLEQLKAMQAKGGHP